MKIKQAYRLQNGGIDTLQLGDFYRATTEKRLLNVYPVERQTVLGFGGAFTDSAAYNYAQMRDAEKQKTLEALFGETGLRYNYCRLCIGSSDFAVEEYCYVEDGDTTLDSFSIERDRQYVIPFVKDAIAYAGEKIVFFASPWSPPAFMKENNTRFSGGKLKQECYELYAAYLAKYLLAYREEGIFISMLTLQNEAKAKQTWESCQYTAEEEAALALVVRAYFDKCGLEDIKLLVWDHNKERLFERAETIFRLCGDVVDGIAFHWYSGDHFEAVDLVRTMYPSKLLVEGEFCIAGGSDYVRTSYAKEILCNLTHGAHGICEWNLILDEEGGPYHNRKGGCDAPVRYNSATGEIARTDIYHQMYMASHFVAHGAKVLATSSFDSAVFVGAFRNPNGEIVVIALNEKDESFADTKIYIGGKFLDLPLPAHTQITLVLEDA